jgi:hypothetical protein
MAAKKSPRRVPADFNLDNILAQLPQAQLPQAQLPHTQQYATNVSGGAKSSTSKAAGKAAGLSKNYVEVPKNVMKSIPPGTYIRYRTATGELKPGGGRVKSFDDENMTLSNYNYSTKKYFVWKVDYSDISKIYKYIKPTDSQTEQVQPSQVQPNQVQLIQVHTEPEYKTAEDQLLNEIGTKMLFNDTELMQQKINNLETELQRIDADLKKVFLLVKRLYKHLNLS